MRSRKSIDAPIRARRWSKCFRIPSNSIRRIADTGHFIGRWPNDDVPLLSHVGYEFSLIGKDQSVGDPNRLRMALDEGVAVIAAHACSYGLMLYEKFYPTLLELVEDVSELLCGYFRADAPQSVQDAPAPA